MLVVFISFGILLLLIAVIVAVVIWDERRPG